jgi:predicted nucleotidyltransferase
MVSFSDIQAKRQQILTAAQHHGAHNVRIFGSVARGDNTSSSDVDFLVKLDDDRSLLDHIALIRELEELLNCKVDVVSEDALHLRIKDQVLAEGRSL